jgi:uncharacterized damage-inducible protein DinB
MKLIEIFKKELENEAATTVRMLSVVPDDKYDWRPHEKSMSIQQLTTHLAEIYDWRPHEKSMSIQQLTTHLAEIPGWIEFMINTAELDFHAGTYKATEIKNTQHLVEVFKANVAKSQEALTNMKEPQLTEIWTMKGGDQIYSAEQKHQAIRHALCQMVHHRAQLGVFLRLLNVPIPASYGASADDHGIF